MHILAGSSPGLRKLSLQLAYCILTVQQWENTQDVFLCESHLSYVCVNPVRAGTLERDQLDGIYFIPFFFIYFFSSLFQRYFLNNPIFRHVLEEDTRIAQRICVPASLLGTSDQMVREDRMEMGKDLNAVVKNILQYGVVGESFLLTESSVSF